MIGKYFSFLLVCSILHLLSAYYLPDEITYLPGWSGKLPSRQFSGYLNLTSGTHLHYWLVEAEVDDPTTAPTVLWLNGGPGCSSLDGFIYEHGPFVVSDNFTTLTLRPYRWNLQANVVYLESPVGVGFSYSDNDNYQCDDDRTAEENMEAMNEFFKMYPEYLNNNFYITGESYGGVYVPTLAETILRATDNGTYSGAKLSGIAVGNGCSGTEVGICGHGPQGTYYQWQYLLQTAFIDNYMKNVVNSFCDWTAASKNKPNALSSQCITMLDQASAQIGNVNLYNIYGECVSESCPTSSSVSLSSSSVSSSSSKITIRGKIPFYEDYALPDDHGRRLARIIPNGPFACIDSKVASGYLNRPEVMQAIHVRDPGFCWAVCNTAPGWTYKSTRKNLPKDTYPLLVSRIQVLIYNGDWDACVPYTDGVGWTEGMNYKVSESWHAWNYTSSDGNPGQVAGYSTVYDVSNMGSGTFAFITVKGGRHEVPETAPGQAFEMLHRVINKIPF